MFQPIEIVCEFGLMAQCTCGRKGLPDVKSAWNPYPVVSPCAQMNRPLNTDPDILVFWIFQVFSSMIAGRRIGWLNGQAAARACQAQAFTALLIILTTIQCLFGIRHVRHVSVLGPKVLPVPAGRELQLRLKFDTGFRKIEIVCEHVEVRSIWILADAADK